LQIFQKWPQPLRQAWILRVPNDQSPQLPRIGERAREYFGIGNHRIAIAKGNCSGVLQKPNLSHFLAQAPFCKRRHLIAAHGASGLCSAVCKFKSFGAINCRICVWPCDQSGHPACGSGQACRAKAFFVPLTRFANFGTNVDNAWREIFSLAVKAWQPRIIGGNTAIFNAQTAQLDGLVLWINQVNICDTQRGHPATHTIKATRAALKISTYMAIFPDMRGSFGSFI